MRGSGGFTGRLGAILGLILVSGAVARDSRADTFATYRSDTPGQYPDVAFLHRPYYIEFKSNRDGATDWFSLFLPSDFDPAKIYPVWFKFKPYYGSGSHATGPSHAWNYCDSNQVIVIGCNLRGTGDAWFGDNQNMDPALGSNIVADTIEILNQLMSMYKISYVAASGASMGGYSSLRFLTHLPQDYVGAAVASCPALWFRPWVQIGSDLISNKVATGFFNEKFVKLMHGTADDTVPVQYSRDLTAAVPDTNGWQLVEVPGGGHAEYFATFDYANYGYPYDEQYGRSPIVSNLWSQIHAWESAHAALTNTYRPPLPGWTTATNWYFPQALYDARPSKGPATNAAPVVNAGPDQTIALPAAATLGGTAADDGLPSNALTIVWSKVTGPGLVAFTNSATANTRATFSTSGVYVLRLAVSDSSLSASDDVQVTVNPEAAGGMVTVLLQKGVSPGTNFTGCADSTLRSLNGATFGLHSLGKDVALDPRWRDTEGAGLVWFDVSSIPSYATIQSATLKLWHEPSEFESVSGRMLLYSLHDPNGTGMWNENTNALYGDYGSGAVAGCALFKRPGVAWASTGEGRYTEVIRGADAVTSLLHSAGVTGWLSFAVARDVQAQVTNSAQNLGWIFYSASDDTIRGQLHTADSTAAKRPVLEIVYSGEPPTNQAPVVDAGTNLTITLPSTAVLGGTAGDDGLPSNLLTIVWSQVSGPGAVAFTNTATANTRASFSTDGVYVLRLTAGDTVLSATDDVQVTVNPQGPNQPPVLGAISNKSVAALALLTFGISATDPEGSALTYSASNMPAGATFVAQTFSWTPSAAQTGVYTVTFYVRDPQLAEDSETIQIDVQPPAGGTIGGSGRIIPPLGELLAASQYLGPGDIAEDTFLPPAAALFVAAAGGSDGNAGTFAAPFATLDKAITVANADPGTAYTIYLRGGIHSFKGVDPYLQIERGNLYITAYSNEAVTIRPYFWPGNPGAWWDQRCFVAQGSYSNVTFDSLTLEGWQIAFEIGSALATPPIRQLAIKNIIAKNFTQRDGSPSQLRVFMETSYLSDDVYGAGKAIFTNPVTAHYQVENLLLRNIEVYDTDITINIGDENDANVKGLRVSDFRLVNAPGGSGGTSANDGFAIVNSYKVLLDNCVIKNVADDGIDTKSFDVAVINTCVEGTGRNGVKFWRNGELINSMIYACTPINDGAFIMQEGPCRVVNSILMSKHNGYAATLGYGSDPATIGSLEIVNSVFADIDGPVYVVHTNMTSKNSVYFDMPNGLFEGAFGMIYNVSQVNARPGSSGNIAVDPQFADADGGDFAPAIGSPLINAGTSAGVLLPSFDYFGRPRITGAQPDVGPIEFSAAHCHPTIDSAEWAASPGCVIRWLGVADVSYRVTAATNLNGPWSIVVSNIPGAGVDLAVTNVPDGEVVRFYRVEALAP